MSSQHPTVSVVSPVYMAEESVPHLVREVRRELEKVTQDYEVILVEDGSPDASWTRIQQACEQDPGVKGLRLSRNSTTP